MTGQGRRLPEARNDTLFQIGVPAAAIVAWEVAVRMLHVSDRLLPAPSAVLAEMAAKAPLLLKHGLVTLSAVLPGFAASVVIGIALGAVLASHRWLSLAAFPLLVFSQTVPKIAVAPLLMIWFGFGIGSKILVAFLIAFFPVLTDTMVGFRAMPPELVMLARSMGARSATIFWRFRLPHALPYIFAGLRIAAVFAVTGTVVAELVGAENGLIYLLLVAQSQYQTSLVFSIVVILAVLSMTLFAGIEVIERWIIPWHSYMRQGGQSHG